MIQYMQFHHEFLFISNDITFCDNQSLNNSISDNVRVENNVK